jgi:hypothetical protein
MRGSLIHDVLYQAMREGQLPSRYRKIADEELLRMCLADGMNRFRAWYVFKSLRAFGGRAIKPRKKSELIRI